MDSTLTIRLDKKHRDALRKRARAEKKSESQLVRELLAVGLEQSYTWDDIKHLAGSIELPKTFSDPLRQRIRENNWRK
jgi:hypothetical protein